MDRGKNEQLLPAGDESSVKFRASHRRLVPEIGSHLSERVGKGEWRSVKLQLVTTAGSIEKGREMMMLHITELPLSVPFGNPASVDDATNGAVNVLPLNQNIQIRHRTLGERHVFRGTHRRTLEHQSANSGSLEHLQGRDRPLLKVEHVKVADHPLLAQLCQNRRRYGWDSRPCSGARESGDRLVVDREVEQQTPVKVSCEKFPDRRIVPLPSGEKEDEPLLGRTIP